jgi:hypothetical protein
LIWHGILEEVFEDSFILGEAVAIRKGKHGDLFLSLGSESVGYGLADLLTCVT